MLCFIASLIKTKTQRQKAKLKKLARFIDSSLKGFYLIKRAFLCF